MTIRYQESKEKQMNKKIHGLTPFNMRMRLSKKRVNADGTYSSEGDCG